MALIQNRSGFQFAVLRMDHEASFSCVDNLFNELIDCNVGFGLGLYGKKLGLGARMFPVRNNSFSPMFGAYFYHVAGAT